MIDLRSADPQSVQALKRLKEPSGEALVKLWRDEVESAKTKLVHARDMDSIHRLQGRAEAFQDLLDAAEDAAKVNR